MNTSPIILKMFASQVILRAKILDYIWFKHGQRKASINQSINPFIYLFISEIVL